MFGMEVKLVRLQQDAAVVCCSAQCCVGHGGTGGPVPPDCASLEAWQEATQPQPPRRAVIQRGMMGSPDQPEMAEHSALASIRSA